MRSPTTLLLLSLLIAPLTSRPLMAEEARQAQIKIYECQKQEIELRKKLVSATPEEEVRLQRELKRLQSCSCKVKREELSRQIDILKEELKNAQERYRALQCQN